MEQKQHENQQRITRRRSEIKTLVLCKITVFDYCKRVFAASKLHREVCDATLNLLMFDRINVNSTVFTNALYV